MKRNTVICVIGVVAWLALGAGLLSGAFGADAGKIFGSAATATIIGLLFFF